MDPHPWYKRTEFWMTVAAQSAGTVLAFAQDNVSLRIAGAAMAVLASFGYTYTRGQVKASAPPSSGK